MKAIYFIVMLTFVCGCAKEIKRNLDDWEGEWKISTGGPGNTSGINEFLSKDWKDANIVHPDFGTLTIDEDGNVTFVFQNNDFSDSLNYFTFKGYLHAYQRSHMELFGLKVTESLDPDMPVGKEVGHKGHMVLWMRDNSGKERVAELDNIGVYNIYSGSGVKWLFFTKE